MSYVNKSLSKMSHRWINRTMDVDNLNLSQIEQHDFHVQEVRATERSGKMPSDKSLIICYFIMSYLDYEWDFPYVTYLPTQDFFSFFDKYARRTWCFILLRFNYFLLYVFKVEGKCGTILDFLIHLRFNWKEFKYKPSFLHQISNPQREIRV